MASTKGTVQSFEQAEEFLAGGRNKNSRPLANNTYVERRTEDRIAVRLHQTDVVEFTRSGLITLHTGGWRTVTTKDRINTCLSWPVHVGSFRGVWYLSTSRDNRWVTKKSDLGNGNVPFADGITLRRINGEWEPIAGTFPDASEEEKIAAARASLDKSIKAYLTKADEVFATWQGALRRDGSLASVAAGDPLCCRGMAREGENDHLWLHLREGYVFPTIVRHAYEDSGRYSEPVQRFLMDLSYGMHDRAKKELRKYLLKHLDPATTVRNAQQRAEQHITAAESALTRPSDFVYYGKDESLYVTSAPTWGRNRDSENVENANFEIVWESLCEEFPDLAPVEGADRHDENPGGIYVFGCSHWAVGWVEQIVVPVLKRPGTVTADNLHPAFLNVCEALDAVALYPALPGAEERAAQMDTEQELADIKSSLQYLENTKDWPVGWLTEHDVSTAIVQDLGEEYDWSTEQVQRAVVALSERLAYDENNAPHPDQGALL